MKDVPEKGRQLLISARHSVSIRYPDEIKINAAKNTQKPVSKPRCQKVKKPDNVVQSAVERKSQTR